MASFISCYQFLRDLFLLCKMSLLQRQTQQEFLSETKISLFVCAPGGAELILISDLDADNPQIKYVDIKI